MEDSAKEYLALAVISDAHGIKGEVKIIHLTDDTEHLLSLEEVILLSPNEKNLGIPTIESIRGHGDFIVKLASVNDRDRALSLKRHYLAVEYESATEELDEGEYYLEDLVNLEVFDENGDLLGVNKNILESNNHFVMEVAREAKKDLLVPLVPEIIIEVDLDKKSIQVKLPNGLLEVYE